MASLNNLGNNDEYYTPIKIWQDILHYLPRDKVYIDPFFGDGSNIENLKSLGLDVVGADLDAFDLLDEIPYDIILTNPAFSKNILIELLFNLDALQKPFILILPITKIFSKYFRRSFRSYKDIQIIIPKERMSFIVPNSSNKSNPSFVCCYVAYKMQLPSDILFL